VSKLGQTYEIFQPRIPPGTVLYGFFTLVLTILTYSSAGILSALFFLGAIFLSVITARRISRKFCGVWFHQQGIRVKTPGSLVPGGALSFWFREEEIPIGTLDDFRWDAQDVEQVENGSMDRWQEITFLISWTDESERFQEIQYTESFEPGSISRLQRATPRLTEMAEEAESQDDYYDE
jgi:hypothetical protein